MIPAESETGRTDVTDLAHLRVFKVTWLEPVRHSYGQTVEVCAKDAAGAIAVAMAWFNRPGYGHEPDVCKLEHIREVIEQEKVVMVVG